MRKRTMSAIADHLYWLLVALLPLVCYLIQFLSYELTSITDSLPTFLSFMQSFGISTDSIIYPVLDDLFGANGILPMFSAGSNAVLLYLSYFVMVQIIHLAVDFLVFIPRLSHKWMEKLTCTEA